MKVEEKRNLTTAAFIVTMIEVVCVITVIWFPVETIALWTTGIAIFIMTLTFVTFLFSMASDKISRKAVPVAVFVVANIVSIVCLFGNMYRWLGLKDTTLAESQIQNPFPLSDAIYFSTVTWTTLGYGDIVASPAARPVAAIEALSGYVVMGLLIAVLLVMVQSDQNT